MGDMADGNAAELPDDRGDAGPEEIRAAAPSIKECADPRARVAQENREIHCHPWRHHQEAPVQGEKGARLR